MLNAENYPYLVIDDFKSHLFAAGGSLAGSTGYKGWQRPGAAHVFQGKRPVGATVPRSEWHDRIQAGQGTFLSDLLKQKRIKAKDQNGRSLCWCYGSVRSVETARALAGLPTLDLSPESVAGPCTDWKDEGGYAGEAFEQLQNAGACESSFMDRPYSLNPTRWKSGWQANARLHEAVVWADIDTSFDEVITCLLERVPVAAGLDWWGHLVCFLDPVILPDGSVGVLFQNSWGVDWPKPGANGFATLTERKATPNGAAAPMIVTASDA
jgi:hypothetical protein